MALRVLYYMDSLTGGGIESQTTGLLAHIDRSRFEPELVVLYGERRGRSQRFLPAMQAANVQVYMLDQTLDLNGKLNIWRLLIKHCRRFQPHVLHTVSYHTNIITTAARPFLPRKTRWVVSVRAENTTRQIQTQQIGWRLADKIICNSEHIRQQLMMQANIDPNKIAVILNGIDTEEYKRSPAVDVGLQSFAGKRLIVTLGRINWKKSQYVLVEALGILKAQGNLPADLCALVVGEVDDPPTQQRIVAVMAQYGLHDVVIQHPQTDSPASYYHAAEFTVLPSLSEGLPNVMLESLAAGKPVLISEGGNKAGVIQHGSNGWVFRTGDSQHLADVLLEAFSTPPAHLRENCLHTAERFSMAEMVAQHEAVYDSVS
jgi:glycosyltransferase involved in cell wall biosynthesis